MRTQASGIPPNTIDAQVAILYTFWKNERNVHQVLMHRIWVSVWHTLRHPFPHSATPHSTKKVAKKDWTLCTQPSLRWSLQINFLTRTTCHWTAMHDDSQFPFKSAGLPTSQPASHCYRWDHPVQVLHYAVKQVPKQNDGSERQAVQPARTELPANYHWGRKMKWKERKFIQGGNYSEVAAWKWMKEKVGRWCWCGTSR